MNKLAFSTLKPQYDKPRYSEFHDSELNLAHILRIYYGWVEPRLGSKLGL